MISSMIAELRFVFGENETVTDLRERELVIYEREFFLEGIRVERERDCFAFSFFSFRL